MPVPELVAPAGDWECARAAVENGADAIYFGLERHNARMRAGNFTLQELPRLMAFLHRRAVKGYLTFNTLVFENELAEAQTWLREIIAARVDAAIVQDIGICRLIRRLSPDFPIHASTQMTVTSAGGVEFVKDLGCSMVVLARECSVNEIRRIHSALTVGVSETAGESAGVADSGQPMPALEVFIHGALCVAYSGQCLTSEALGGRSANRGVCAQACRMPYEMISDGECVPLGDRRYLLSPRDLAGLEVVPDLVRAGVRSLKIEGRLKSPEYVANITRIYRQALDRLRQSSTLHLEAGHSPAARESHPVGLKADSVRYDMEMAFSRGLYTGWLRGLNNQELVHGRFGKKRGVYLGDVVRVQGQAVWVKLTGPLKPGDGVVFDAGRPDEDEEGGRVYEIRRSSAPAGLGQETMLTFGRGDVNFRRVRPGNKLWKTSDPELDRHLRQTFAGDQLRFQRPLSLTVLGGAGERLRLVAQDESGLLVELSSDIDLVPADNQPLSPERLRAQLGRLGGTPFRLGDLNFSLKGRVMLPVSELNRLRREMVRQLEELRAKPVPWTLQPSSASDGWRPGIETAVTTGAAGLERGEIEAPELIALVRSMEQLQAVLRGGLSTVYCEFEDPKRYREAVALVRSAAVPPSARPVGIFVAPPRVHKPGEEWMLQQVRSAEADGYLVRNYDHLTFFADCRRVGDYGLNIANSLAAEYFYRRFGLERLTASYDLNTEQLEALLRAAPPAWFEVSIHQHMPMFHMEHCVFCSFLSEGTDYTNCGRPCEKHQVKLRDRVGAEHPVKADAGCRNTVFNAVAQTGAEAVARFLALGLRRFRVEFMDESPEEVIRILGFYHQLLRGQITGGQLWRELRLFNQLGVTRGPLGQSQ